MSDYTPKTDEGFRTYTENFAEIISNDPSTYMLTVAQAASIQQLVDDYVERLAIANNQLN